MCMPIVLSWLDGNPRRYKTFVGNRIANITNLPHGTMCRPGTIPLIVPLEVSPRVSCSPTHCGGMDLPGLGQTLCPCLLNLSCPQPLLVSSGTPELKAVCLAVIPVPPAWIEESFSSYHMLIYVNSWCLRFPNNLKSSVRKQPKCISPYLTSTEVNSSSNFCFVEHNHKHFLTKSLN